MDVGGALAALDGADRDLPTEVGVEEGGSEHADGRGAAGVVLGRARARREPGAVGGVVLDAVAVATVRASAGSTFGNVFISI